MFLPVKKNGEKLKKRLSKRRRCSVRNAISGLPNFAAMTPISEPRLIRCSRLKPKRKVSLEKSADSYAAKILPDSEEPQIDGKQFGHYKIIREIGNWDEAVSSYQKSLQTFVELRDRNALQPRDAGQIDKFTQQIQMCEAERAKLAGS